MSRFVNLKNNEKKSMRILYILSVLLITYKLQANNAPKQFLISAEKVKSHSKQTIRQLWKKNKIPQIVLPVRHDVDIYEIMYWAPWIDQKTWIKCSGICFIPKSEKPVPTFMFGHGTEIRKGRDISDNDAQQGICLGMATDGYLALYPDYYGIGKGDGNHLYQHAWSEGMAFIYMLYAVEELKSRVNVQTNGQLFLTGYSQGGHASFAAQKYIEELNDPRFQVTATSPMSGAYDMTGEQAKYMFEEYPKPFYLPYLLTSYQEAYKILDTDDVFSVFKSPFDSLLKGFFGTDRSKTYSELDRIMPKVPAHVIKDDLIQQYLQDSLFPFKVRLKENNLTHWSPKAPVQLCYCKGDREVNYMNSEVVYNNMKKQGIHHIKLNNLSNRLDHNTCAAFAVLATKYYFDRFKKNGKNPKLKDVPPFKKFLAGIIKKKIEKQYDKDKRDKAYM